MVFADSPFAFPKSPFGRPVPLVLVDPCDQPDVTISFRHEWKPYILGALQALVLQATWDTTDPAALQLVQNRAQELLSCIMDDQGVCRNFFPSSPDITYAPMNPFTNPGEIPPGYIAPPWYVVTSDLIPLLFAGAQVGDVLSGYLSVPVLTPGLLQGLARFRLNLSGTGQASIHLINIPHGGSALITKDGDPLSSIFVELNKDLVQIPPETVGEVIVQVEFSLPGDHYIDVTMLPRFNDEILFVAYGGGLRKIELCGFDMPPDTQGCPGLGVVAFPGISLEDSLSTQIRISPADPCIIQMWCIDHWEDWYNPRSCIAGTVTQPPPGGTLIMGQCSQYPVTLAGNSQWKSPVPVQGGYTIKITGTSGGWYDGANWKCPDGSQYVLGACNPLGKIHVGGDPSSTAFHMELIALINGIYYPADNATITVPPGTPLSDVTFQANDASLADNQGSINFNVEICNSTTATFLHNFDLTASRGGWVNDMDASLAYGVYAAGQGWVTTCDGGSDKYTQFFIQHDIPSGIELTDFSVFANIILGDNPSGLNCIIGHDALISGNFLTSINSAAFTSPLVWHGSLTGASKIWALIAVGFHPGGVCPAGGQALTPRITVGGNGSDPF